MNRAAFYDSLRVSRLFNGSLSEGQVKGIEGLLDAFRTHGDGSAKTLAYGLATVRREAGAGMVPVREGFAKTDAAARAMVRKAGRRYATPVGPYGHVYYGRGQVQLTWLDNYVKSSADAGVDLVKNPDAMLDPTISSRILWRGIQDGRWNAQGHGVAHYLATDDLKNARRTVNITDHWQEIAGHYAVFLAAIEAAGGVDAVARPQRPVEPDAPTLTAEELGAVQRLAEWRSRAPANTAAVLAWLSEMETSA
jgi:hypothetical protein